MDPLSDQDNKRRKRLLIIAGIILLLILALLAGSFFLTDNENEDNVPELSEDSVNITTSEVGNKIEGTTDDEDIVDNWTAEGGALQSSVQSPSFDDLIDKINNNLVEDPRSKEINIIADTGDKEQNVTTYPIPGDFGPDNAFFEVDITDVPSEIEVGNKVTVNYEVQNTEGRSDVQDIEFFVNNSLVSTNSVELDGNNSTVGKFSYTTNEDDFELINLEVRSDNSSDVAQVNVRESAFFDLSISDVPDNTVEGKEFAVDYNVDNTGEVSDTQMITLTVDGKVVKTKSVSMDGGTSINDQFTYETSGEDVPQVTLNVSSEDSSDEKLVDVFNQSFFTAEITEIPDSVVAGDNFELSYKIENTGDVEESQTVEFVVDGTVIETRDLELEGGESETNTFSYGVESSDIPNFDVSVATEDDSDESNVGVVSPPEISFIDNKITVEQTEEFSNPTNLFDLEQDWYDSVASDNATDLGFEVVVKSPSNRIGISRMDGTDENPSYPFSSFNADRTDADSSFGSDLLDGRFSLYYTSEDPRSYTVVETYADNARENTARLIEDFSFDGQAPTGTYIFDVTLISVDNTGNQISKIDEFTGVRDSFVLELNEEPPVSELSNLDVADQGDIAKIVETESGDVEVDVENLASTKGDFSVDLNVVSGDGVNVVDETKSVSVDRTSTEDLRFDGVIDGLQPGNYDVSLSTDDDEITGELTVSEQPTGEFNIDFEKLSPYNLGQEFQIGSENAVTLSDPDNVVEDLEFDFNVYNASDLILDDPVQEDVIDELTVNPENVETTDIIRDGEQISSLDDALDGLEIQEFREGLEIKFNGSINDQGKSGDYVVVFNMVEQTDKLLDSDEENIRLSSSPPKFEFSEESLEVRRGETFENPSTFASLKQGWVNANLDSQATDLGLEITADLPSDNPDLNRSTGIGIGVLPEYPFTAFDASNSDVADSFQDDISDGEVSLYLTSSDSGQSDIGDVIDEYVDSKDNQASIFDPASTTMNALTGQHAFDAKLISVQHQQDQNGNTFVSKVDEFSGISDSFTLDVNRQPTGSINLDFENESPYVRGEKFKLQDNNAFVLDDPDNISKQINLEMNVLVANGNQQNNVQENVFEEFTVNPNGTQETTIINNGSQVSSFDSAFNGISKAQFENGLDVSITGTVNQSAEVQNYTVVLDMLEKNSNIASNTQTIKVKYDPPEHEYEKQSFNISKQQAEASELKSSSSDALFETDNGVNFPKVFNNTASFEGLTQEWINNNVAPNATDLAFEVSINPPVDQLRPDDFDLNFGSVFGGGPPFYPISSAFVETDLADSLRDNLKDGSADIYLTSLNDSGGTKIGDVIEEYVDNSQRNEIDMYNNVGFGFQALVGQYEFESTLVSVKHSINKSANPGFDSIEKIQKFDSVSDSFTVNVLGEPTGQINLNFSKESPYERNKSFQFEKENAFTLQDPKDEIDKVNLSLRVDKTNIPLSDTSNPIDPDNMFQSLTVNPEGTSETNIIESGTEISNFNEAFDSLSVQQFEDGVNVTVEGKINKSARLGDYEVRIDMTGNNNNGLRQFIDLRSDRINVNPTQPDLKFQKNSLTINKPNYTRTPQPERTEVQPTDSVNFSSPLKFENLTDGWVNKNVDSNATDIGFLPIIELPIESFDPRGSPEDLGIQIDSNSASIYNNLTGFFLEPSSITNPQQKIRNGTIPATFGITSENGNKTIIDEYTKDESEIIDIFRNISVNENALLGEYNIRFTLASFNHTDPDGFLPSIKLVDRFENVADEFTINMTGEPTGITNLNLTKESPYERGESFEVTTENAYIINDINNKGNKPEFGLSFVDGPPRRNSQGEIIIDDENNFEKLIVDPEGVQATTVISNGQQVRPYDEAFDQVSMQELRDGLDVTLTGNINQTTSTRTYTLSSYMLGSDRELYGTTLARNDQRIDIIPQAPQIDFNKSSLNVIKGQKFNNTNSLAGLKQDWVDAKISEQATDLGIEVKFNFPVDQLDIQDINNITFAPQPPVFPYTANFTDSADNLQDDVQDGIVSAYVTTSNSNIGEIINRYADNSSKNEIEIINDAVWGNNSPAGEYKINATLISVNHTNVNDPSEPIYIKKVDEFNSVSDSFTLNVIRGDR